MNQGKQRQSSVHTEQQNRKSYRRSASAVQSGRKISHSAITLGDNQIQITMINNITQCLAKKKIYVEIYSGPQQNDRNQSDCEDEILYALGASIVKKLSKHTHYLIWQYGFLSTLEKAKEWNIKIVNPMWVNECLTKKREVDASNFPIIELTPQEIQELLKKERVHIKKGKQSNQQIQDEEEEEVNEFKTRHIFSLYKNQLQQIAKGFNKSHVPISNFKQTSKNLIHEELDTEQLEASQKINSQFLSKKSSKALKSKQQQIDQKFTLAIHKSCDCNMLNLFEHINSNDQYQLVTEEDMKIKCDILIINEDKLIYDLVFCCCCLNKQTKIISQKWILKQQQNLKKEIAFNPFQLTYNMQKKILFPYNFYVYFSKPKSSQQKTINQNLRSGLEQLIQNFGGKITQKEFCDIMIVMKIMFKTTAQAILNSNPNIKIIHAEWLYKSIQQGCLIDLNEYIIQQ
ncbi:unnamed protein product (macronuclear) [Paramecium tetraurelia]|uniref:BRCT domain-containing protein n=1 Tax=Paramecium tetraurelia TaxID=5888 RepID=A0CNI2_PARTE|nr:uncharacterized protein GSPATT00008791001 [Paramecium tetraurelia]CAK72349.1 unnamed protein product [Paramecium tetraurelia]|eukprot:XP_001439746.1 hypothetical protein (macronuclear) [Paramecium tetraurelia strain d4-2]